MHSYSELGFLDKITFVIGEGLPQIRVLLFHPRMYHCRFQVRTGVDEVLLCSSSDLGPQIQSCPSRIPCRELALFFVYARMSNNLVMTKEPLIPTPDASVQQIQSLVQYSYFRIPIDLYRINKQHGTKARRLFHKLPDGIWPHETYVPKTRRKEAKVHIRSRREKLISKI